MLLLSSFWTPTELYFDLYRHGNLDFKFVFDRAKSVLEATRFVQRKVYISEAEIAEENNRTTSYGEKVCL